VTLKPEDSSEIILTLKKFIAHQTVDMNILCDIGIDTASHFMSDQLAAVLKARVHADDLPPETFTARDRVTYEIPASTWQMWKKRHAHRWYARRLVARWPVRYELDPDRRGPRGVHVQLGAVPHVPPCSGAASARSVR
jgi:hypothetical protein